MRPTPRRPSTRKSSRAERADLAGEEGFERLRSAEAVVPPTTASDWRDQQAIVAVHVGPKEIVNFLG
jgi:hypothetical protein